VIFSQTSFEVNFTPLRENSVEIEKNDSLMVQNQDYKMDASKLPNQVLSIFNGSPKMSGVVVIERRLSY